MNRQTLVVFHALLRRGYIDRGTDLAAWEAYQDLEVQSELDDFRAELAFDLYRSHDRLYLIPTQENDLFLKDNVAYRRDVSGSGLRQEDLYLLNYLSIYLLYLFFRGEDSNPQTREFMTKEAFIQAFTEHCSKASQPLPEGTEDNSDYGENFRRLAESWLAKITGEEDARAMNTRYGCVNRMLSKYRTDELFTVDDQHAIRPTRKLVDLMPYFLRRERVTEIHAWMTRSDDLAGEGGA